MSTEIKMPQLSDTMNAGKILAWKKREGEAVQRGDVLAEVETEKANLEIEAFAAGTLLKILVPANSTAKVGEVIAVIGSAQESAPAPKATAPQSSPTPPVSASQSSSRAPQAYTPESGTSAGPSASSHVAPPSAVKPSAPATQQSSVATEDESDSGRVKASPLAKQLARQRHIDLSGLQGSGPDGRIVKKDIDALLQNGNTIESPSESPSAKQAPATTATKPEQAQEAEPQQAPVPSPASQPSASTERATGPVQGKLTNFTKMRETIARRMQESVTQSPHFYTTTAIEMTEASRLREILKERPEFKGISINHLVVKAAAYALAREPRVNRAVRGEQIFEPDQINIGIITAVDDGLLIPVIRDADKLALRDIVFEARAAIERARAGRPNSSDLSGGTFSISNMGMFDVESFTAIINPGQGAVLAVGATKDEPIVRNGAVVAGRIMRATLSVDHRVIDGVMSGMFLKHFKEALETPALLLI